MPPFDKKTQAKKKSKTNNDKLIYEQIAERSYDWIDGYNKCEYCHSAPAQHMHHDPPRSRGGKTSLETTFHICEECHRNWHLGRHL